MVAVDLNLIGATVDGFVWIKQWPIVMLTYYCCLLVVCGKKKINKRVNNEV